MERKMIATFNVESGKIMASDPCYGMDVWCNGSFCVRNGKYVMFLARGIENERWGERNFIMEIIHEDFAYLKDTEFDWEMCGGTFGVDSGTFGFFDYDYYEKFHSDGVDEKWYDRNVCDIEGNWNADIDDKGVWCQSGYGDGAYDVDALWDGDECVGLMVTFIYKEDDEDVANWEEVSE